MQFCANVWVGWAVATGAVGRQVGGCQRRGLAAVDLADDVPAARVGRGLARADGRAARQVRQAERRSAVAAIAVADQREHGLILRHLQDLPLTGQPTVRRPIERHHEDHARHCFHGFNPFDRLCCATRKNGSSRLRSLIRAALKLVDDDDDSLQVNHLENGF